MRHAHRLVWTTLLAATSTATVATAQNAMTTERVASGVTRPVFVTYAPGADPNWLFVVEQRGSQGVATRGNVRILNLSTNTFNANPFVAINGVTTSSEQGLLGLTFSPNYATDRYFFVNYTTSGGGAAGRTMVKRYRRSPTDPNIADPALADPNSAQTTISINQPFNNHNGGWIEFGPDGYLYISMGDGGSGGDPGNRAQNLNELLGKMLRLDVLTDPNQPYTIPGTNPFVGVAGLDEIWAYGLRNAWRNSFDRETGDFYIADVGQDLWEEINFQPAGAAGGRNYGWKCYEGTHTYSPGFCSDPNLLTYPFLEYAHDPNLVIPPTNQSGCSINGGVVYRGCRMPWLRGTYFFADLCNNQIYSLRYNGSVISDFANRTTELDPPCCTINSIVSFGEDASGEIYIVDQGGGEIYRIEPRCDGDINGDGRTDQDDLDIVLFNFGLNGLGDLNCDGQTTQDDLDIVLFYFGCVG